MVIKIQTTTPTHNIGIANILLKINNTIQNENKIKNKVKNNNILYLKIKNIIYITN